MPPTELIVIRPYDDAPIARLRETGVEVDQPSRPALEALRLEDDEPAAQRPGQRGRAPRGLLTRRSWSMRDGLVTEGTHTSVLWVRGGRLEGTPEGPGILPGHHPAAHPPALRRDRHPVRRGPRDPPELIGADEVFLVGTTSEVLLDRPDRRPGRLRRRARARVAAAPGGLPRARRALAGRSQPA